MFFGGEKTHLCRPQDGLVTPFLHQKLAMNKASESESCFIFHGFSGVAAGGWLWVGGDGSDIHLTLDFDFRHFFRILDGMIFFVFFWKSLKKKNTSRTLGFPFLQTYHILRNSAGFFQSMIFPKFQELGPFLEWEESLVPWRFFFWWCEWITDS